MNAPATTKFGFVIDCNDAGRLAEFWSQALGYANVGSAGNYVALYPTEGTGPKLLLQQVAEPKSVKNRMHLDIEVLDIVAEAARLVALGATQLDTQPCSEHGATWMLMLDPEGNEFCVCDAGQTAVP